MAFGDLTNKLEAASLSLLAANAIAGLTGFTGQSAAQHIRPAVIFKAERGDEFPQGSGNFKLQLVCQVQSSADDTSLAAHRNFFAGVVDLFTDSAFAANISAQLVDFFVFGAYGARFNEEVQDRANISELALELYCCASDIGA